MGLPLFLWTLAAAPTTQIITSALLVDSCLRGGLQCDRFRRSLRLNGLRRRARRAGCYERRKAWRLLFRLPILEPGLRLLASVAKLRLTHLLVTLGPLIVGTTVLPVAIIEWAILARPAILLGALLIARLAVGVGLRSSVVWSHRGLLVEWRAELGRRGALGGRRETVGKAAEIVVVISLVCILRLVLRPYEAWL